MTRFPFERNETATGDTPVAVPTGIPSRGASGYRFRSRLEAKWAHLFTALGWRWEYEPLDLPGWIPDFLLHTQPLPTLVEVKPESTLRDLQTYIPKLERALGAEKPGADPCQVLRTNYEVLLLGCTACPFPDSIDEVAYEPLGLLGELVNGERDYDAAKWMVCLECEAVSFFHARQSFRSRICGHYDGDHHLSPAPTATDRDGLGGGL
jgi:hypothetical protein